MGDYQIHHRLPGSFILDQQIEKTDKDGNLYQEVTMSYHAHAVGITSGTKYIIHEKDVQTTQQD